MSINEDLSDSECEFDDDAETSENEDIEPMLCWFCNVTFNNCEVSIAHLKEVHDVNLAAMKAKFDMDIYSYVKLITFIRTKKVDSSVIATATEELWKDDKYLKPLQYESWYLYDFDDLKPESDINSQNNEPQSNENIEQNSKEEFEAMRTALDDAKNNVLRLTKGIKMLMEKDDDDSKEQKNTVSSVPLSADEGYFGTYAHFSIHHDMLSDRVRTLAYKEAIDKNKEIIKSKTVLDVGCGTSILSMFASAAGADKIVAIDNSDIIYNAMDIVRRNNISNIEFIKGRLEDTNLPIDKFDIIISEWMGYFLIFEGMLDTIIYARDRHMKPGGTIMPNRCNISLVGYGDEVRHQNYIAFWDSVYGYNMSNMKKAVLQEPLIEICKSEFVITEPNIIADYDLNTVDLSYPNFSYDFNLKVTKDGKLTSFVGYFDTFFDLLEKVSFSTSPFGEPTHWKQVVFFIENPIPVKENDLVSGKITCERNRKDMRALNISIKLNGKTLNYHLD